MATRTLVLVLSVLVLLAAGCRNEKACRERCAALGTDPGSEQCTMLCTTSCKELNQTFGVDEAHCHELQYGR